MSENKDAQYLDEYSTWAYSKYGSVSQEGSFSGSSREGFIAGRRKGQELIDRQGKTLFDNGVAISKFNNEIESLKKEIEELKMKPILHKVSNAFRDQKSEIDKLRELVELAKPLMHEAEQSTGLVHRMREWLRGAEAMK